MGLGLSNSTFWILISVLDTLFTLTFLRCLFSTEIALSELQNSKLIRMNWAMRLDQCVGVPFLAHFVLPHWSYSDWPYVRSSHAGLLLFLLFFGVDRGVSACPPSESIAPLCHCTDFLRTRAMVCDRVLSPDELIGPARAASVGGRAVESLTIRNSSLLYVPAAVFKDTGIQKVSFLSTELLSLSDSDVAFEGLEETLSEVRASDARYAAQWDWHQLRNLRRLRLIDIDRMVLESVDEPFPPLPALQFLGVTRAGIQFLVEGAFASLAHLRVLNLKQNALSEVRRNMLPDPATHLDVLDLSSNGLSSLPGNFFTGMPSLTTVQLDSNRLTTLTEDSFSWALRNLRELTMSGNALRCDCRLRWMVPSRRPPTLVARCHAPEHLAGRPLQNLDEKLLWC